MQQLGSETIFGSSRTKEAFEKGARFALASVVFCAAVFTGATKGAQEAYADEVDGGSTVVVPISATLVDLPHDDTGIKNNVNVSSAARVGEGMASQVVKMHTDALSAMPTREEALLDLAYEQLGVPYVYGGTTPSGFDCSGFTQYIFREALGIELPRSAAAQYGVGESVSLDELQAGDLVFWGSGKGIYHVGLYIGDGNYIHAGNSSRSICIQSMAAYKPTCAKRLL